jgi:serine/threonine protein kinase
MGEICSVHVCGGNRLTVSSNSGEYLTSIPVRTVVARFDQGGRRGTVCSLANWAHFMDSGLDAFKPDDDLTRSERSWRFEMDYGQALSFRRQIEKLGIVQTDFSAQFKVKKRIGKGGFSEVFLAQQVDTRATVAAKMMKHGVVDADCNPNPVVWDDFADEVRILSTAQGHDNILRMHATYLVCPEDDLPGLVMITEHLPLGLLELVREHGKLPEAATRGVVESLLRALAHLNSFNIAHRDVKTSNVMLRSLVKGGVVLVDYGFGCVVKGTEVYPSLIGTPGYFAPELFVEGEKVDSRRADVFSVGIVAMSCLTGRSVFPEKGKDGKPDKWAQYELNKRCEFDWAAVAPCMTDVGLDSMSELLEVDPRQRPFAAAALKSRWYDLAFEDCVEGTLPAATECELAYLTSPRPLLRKDAVAKAEAMTPTPPQMAPTRRPGGRSRSIVTRKTGSNSGSTGNSPATTKSLRSRATIK